jgi:VIT1/CCC1 family predicted Fe2+/Mn2+ transporter
MRWTRWAAAVTLGACALAATGCGYALAGRGSFLPAYIRTVVTSILEAF